MRIIYVLIICLHFTSCSNPSEHKVIKEFPEQYFSTGNDDDHSFKSLTAQRQKDGTLKALVTDWSLEEYGLHLSTQTENKTLTLHLMGECGTVSSHTYIKRTFEYSLSRREEDSLEQIQFSTFVLAK